jgi:hypothetical protein
MEKAKVSLHLLEKAVDTVEDLDLGQWHRNNFHNNSPHTHKATALQPRTGEIINRAQLARGGHRAGTQ